MVWTPSKPLSTLLPLMENLDSDSNFPGKILLLFISSIVTINATNYQDNSNDQRLKDHHKEVEWSSSRILFNFFPFKGSLFLIKQEGNSLWGCKNKLSFFYSLMLAARVGIRARVTLSSWIPVAVAKIYYGSSWGNARKWIRIPGLDSFVFYEFV